MFDAEVTENFLHGTYCKQVRRGLFSEVKRYDSKRLLKLMEPSSLPYLLFQPQYGFLFYTISIQFVLQGIS